MASKVSGPGPSYHNRFYRTRFTVIYVSKEEPMEVNLPTAETQDEAPTPSDLGGQCSSVDPWPRATLRAAQLLASPVHWQLPRGYQRAGSGQIVRLRPGHIGTKKSEV